MEVSAALLFDVGEAYVVSLAVTLCESKKTRGCTHLCASLEAGIKGAIHMAISLWQEYINNDEYTFLIIDVRNTFNEGNCAPVIWNVQQHW